MQPHASAPQHYHHQDIGLTSLHTCAHLGTGRGNATLPCGLKLLSMLEISPTTTASQIWPGGLRLKRQPALGKVKNIIGIENATHKILCTQQPIYSNWNSMERLAQHLCKDSVQICVCFSLYQNGSYGHDLDRTKTMQNIMQCKQ